MLLKTKIWFNETKNLYFSNPELKNNSLKFDKPWSSISNRHCYYKCIIYGPG